jgi:hypothetical protein
VHVTSQIGARYVTDRCTLRHRSVHVTSQIGARWRTYHGPHPHTPPHFFINCCQTATTALVELPDLKSYSAHWASRFGETLLHAAALRHCALVRTIGLSYVMPFREQQQPTWYRRYRPQDDGMVDALQPVSYQAISLSKQYPVSKQYPLGNPSADVLRKTHRCAHVLCMPPPRLYTMHVVATCVYHTCRRRDCLPSTSLHSFYHTCRHHD